MVSQHLSKNTNDATELNIIWRSLKQAVTYRRVEVCYTVVVFVMQEDLNTYVSSIP